jgi:uncharacterized protein
LPVILLDANVLIALAWPEHTDHQRAGRWFAARSRSGWATCPFTQAAFVRVLSNPAFSANTLTPQNASAVLESNLELPGHHFWQDRITLAEAIRNLNRAITGHRQVSDVYLLGLTIHYKGKLATMDRGIAALDDRGIVELIG